MTGLKLDDLVGATGATPRHIRYLIAEGFMPPPMGGRTYATYSAVHVTAIRRYERLRSLGFPPAAIRLLLDAREGIPVPIMPGLTLVIAPELIGSGGDVATIAAKGAMKIEELLSKEAPDERKHAAR
ncbi:helix-turn-helix domain-containing protein [Sphingobium subterraneum]|uniref:DNA-binding transcriptional MerR regulator n=1 Tax=Sphingobium subterraneum TaxID=627688 RepID=A0A841J141_9SPHN|nr:helix-turn-helix domain-containing protein [Sphingobium subterraneum]MBB6124899.1 DNA-binding transcriptional MerR regulator [Sphingobium subterraneum]